MKDDTAFRVEINSDGYRGYRWSVVFNTITVCTSNTWFNSKKNARKSARNFLQRMNNDMWYNDVFDATHKSCNVAMNLGLPDRTYAPKAL